MIQVSVTHHRDGYLMNVLMEVLRQARMQEVAREMEYLTAGEDGFEMQVDRTILSASQSSLEFDSTSSSNRYHGELRA